MRAPLHVEVSRRGREWVPGTREIGAWAGAALGRRASGRELAVRVVGARESRRLNARYRGHDKPTNVLSFPVVAGAQRSLPGVAARPLGDLVICSSVVRREARGQGKSIRAHWAHLIVHGALHLIGYDHEEPREARRMERREVAILRQFGIANPYREDGNGH
ncbi:MAG TPA: rRNA maturation RNase YbeY [Steroidobacteraceae bacterium]|nr:rRNA maturation RNase YbeY [Steroidobacteraceae bacterium]